MTTVDTAIIETLVYLSKKSRKNYALPSQEGILKLLVRFHGVVICRRTLNYHLKKLVNEGYILRVRRISEGPGRVAQFKSTMYWLFKKVYQFFRKQAVFLQSIGFTWPELVRSWKKEARTIVQAPVEEKVYLTPDENLVQLRKLKAVFGW